MPKLSPRNAVKLYRVSRATLMNALSDGTISAEKTDAGHWRIDPSELRRVYSPRVSQAIVSRSEPDQVSRATLMKALSHGTINAEKEQEAIDHSISARLAIAEGALAAEREKTAMLQRHLDDVRRMLPPPAAARPRHRWWW
jgi:hypothetical protein